MNYPLPRNHFSVDWGGTRIGFSEVSGLTIAAQSPAFRDGTMVENSDVTMPGILRYPNLVDAGNSPAVIWRLRNAFPVKLEYSSLEAGNSGPMMEILEIAHEGMAVENN